jgi:hypothetical protein
MPAPVGFNSISVYVSDKVVYLTFRGLDSTYMDTYTNLLLGANFTISSSSYIGPDGRYSVSPSIVDNDFVIKLYAVSFAPENVAEYDSWSDYLVALGAYLMSDFSLLPEIPKYTSTEIADYHGVFGNGMYGLSVYTTEADIQALVDAYILQLLDLGFTLDGTSYVSPDATYKIGVVALPYGNPTFFSIEITALVFQP